MSEVATELTAKWVGLGVRIYQVPEYDLDKNVIDNLLPEWGASKRRRNPR
jgi:hypothetical protein